MTFAQPMALLGLLAIPVLVAAYVLMRRRRRRYVVRFTNLALLSTVVPRQAGWRRHVPAAVLMLGLAALLVGLAQPLIYLEVARNDASVMLVIDVSGSMQATDVAPNRLSAAESAAQTLIKTLPANDRVGLISFNSSARLEQGLTDNRQLVQGALANLHAGGSTAIGSAISLAVQQLDSGPRQASPARRPASLIVLLTDGASNAGIDPTTAAGQAQAAGIPVDTIGIGMRGGNVRVQGQEIGGVDEPTLQAIAQATGGKYFYAEEASQLNGIYSALGSEFGWHLVHVNIGPYLIVAGLLIVLVAAAASMAWFRVPL